jgi:hypothetical protein
MGLVPHEHSTVGKLSLLDISKRGELVSATTVRTKASAQSATYREAVFRFGISWFACKPGRKQSPK